MPISQNTVTMADGTVEIAITVPFLVNPLPSPACLTSRPLILNLGISQLATGGSLNGGQSAFYCLAALDSGGLISARSQFIEVVIPSGTNTNQVILSGPTPFDANAVNYQVYRSLGDSLSAFLIAGPSSVPGGGTFTFTDTGLATANILPPSENYKKDRVYWRLTGTNYWNLGGETHDSSQSSVTFYVPTNLAGQSLDIQVRPVAADGKEQSASIATVYNYTITAAYPQALFISNTNGTGGSPIDLTNKGSIPPTLNDTTFSYTSTTTSAVITFAAFTLYRPNGDSTTVSTGNVTVTGLTANTTYYVYPFFDEVTQTVVFVTGGVGTPAICFTAQNPVALQSSSLQRATFLNSGPITVVTPASGTGGGTGGGGGSGGGGRGYL